jgi:hypothetical protein
MWRLASLIALCCCASCVEPVLAHDDAGEADAGAWRCSPLTCTGCCRDNQCLGGNAQAACGYDGRSCRECGTDTNCVSPGTCAGLPGDGGSTSRGGSDGGLINPLTGGPLQPPTQKCVFIYGFFVCS